MRFKQFLEAQVGNDVPQYTKLAVQEAHALLNSKCKNALWMLHEDRPIYRGDIELQKSVSATGFSVFDANLTTRRSQNTKNYYTLIFDNHPKMQDFPKRSKSIIGSTERHVALTYANNSIHRKRQQEPEHPDADLKGQSVVIIPFDDSRIGETGQEDIWHIHTTLFDQYESLPQFNIAWANAQMSDIDWSQWIKFDEDMKRGHERPKRPLGIGFERYQEYFTKYENDFLETVFQAYSPAVTGMRAGTTSTISKHKNQEVWVGDKMLCISSSMWNRLRSEL